MSDLNTLSIHEARTRLDNGEITAVELAEDCLNAVRGASSLNAIVRINEERAIEDAKRADQALASGNKKSLTGIPIAIKDLFCVQGERTQAASNILDGFTPTYESTVTSNLWAEGAVMMGTANMDQFAMGSSNETSCYGNAVNPWRLDQDLTPGGSSGGSAAAVSADLALAATATDTGGSIRQPASFTGTVGIKPTYGRASRYGIIAFASSLDQAGPITKNVRDSAMMLNAMCGHDPKDSTSAPQPKSDFTSQLEGSIKGKTIGIPKEYRVEGMDEEIEALWQQSATMLKDLGANIVDISLPMTKYALPAYYVIAPAEASSNLARYDGVRYGARAALDSGDGIHEMYAKTRAQGFGSEVQRRIMIGTYVLSAGFYDAYYTRAQKVRSLIKRDFETVYDQGVDAILTPTAPSAAFALGAMQDADPVTMYLNDVFTVTVNMAGLPGISIPAGLSKAGLPLGMQLIGKPFEEGELLNFAQALETQIDFNTRPKKWWTT